MPSRRPCLASGRALHGAVREGGLGLALVALVLVLGCARPKAAAPTALCVEVESSPLSFDPRFATDAVSSRVGELLFDALLRVDAAGRFKGNLAESVESPAPLTLVFHLRPGARFTDGRPLTARDVKYSYDSVRDPATLSPKRAGLEPLAQVLALDRRTVVMRLKRVYAPALEMALLGVVPYGTPARPKAGPRAVVGSGPLRLVRFVRDDWVELARNRFRPAPVGAPRRVIFRIVPDPTVRVLALAKGSCDFAENNIESALLPYLERRPALRLERAPGTSYAYLAFNFRDRRLADLRVRRAIAYALDRESIVRFLLHDTARLASGMLAPENWAWEPDVARYDYRPERARRLLDEAGYPADSAGMRRLELVFKTTPEGRWLGEVFQGMLKAVGVRLRVRVNEWATFYADIQRGNFDLAALQWVGVNDPHHYYMIFDSRMTPPRGLNRGAYGNPEMDRLVEAGEVALEPQKRRRIYAAVQKLAAADLPYVSLWWSDNVVVMKRRVEGFKPYPNGSLRSLAAVTLESRAELFHPAASSAAAKRSAGGDPAGGR